MKTVFKYPLRMQSEQVVDLPAYAKPLAVGIQGTALVLWAQVDTEMVMVDRTIHIIGTGHQMPRDVPLEYIGTVQEPGPLVWHVFIEVLR